MNMKVALLISACCILVTYCSAAAHIKVSKPRYGAIEDPVVVSWQGIDDNYWNWISIVPAGRPDDFRQMGRFYYTKGKTSGSQQFAPFKFGDYEVRLYLNWPSGGYEVKERIAFVVGDCEHGCSKCDSGQCQEAELGFFIDTRNGFVPRPCDSSCRTCNGASDLRCTSCQNGYTLRENRCERLSKYYFSQLGKLKDEKCPVLFDECGFKGEAFQFCEEVENFGHNLGSVFVPEGYDRFVKVSGASNLFDGHEVVFSQSVECIDKQDLAFLKVNGMHLVSKQVAQIHQNEKHNKKQHSQQKHHKQSE